MLAFCLRFVGQTLWFDLLKTFSRPTRVSVTSKPNTHLVFYAMYGFGVPVLIVSVAVIVQYGLATSIIDNYRPNYGQHICWINSKMGLVVFFLSPLALFTLFDVIAFIATCVFIARANKEGATARGNGKTCTAIINLKLAFIMGTPWALAFIANITKSTSAADVLWIIFIVFNTLQGLFIAISFLCTRKVVRLVKEGFETTFSTSKSTTYFDVPSQ